MIQKPKAVTKKKKSEKPKSISKAPSEFMLSADAKPISKSKQKLKKLDKENVIPNLSQDKVKKAKKKKVPGA